MHDLKKGLTLKIDIFEAIHRKIGRERGLILSGTSFSFNNFTLGVIKKSCERLTEKIPVYIFFEISKSMYLHFCYSIIAEDFQVLILCRLSPKTI